MAVQLSTVVAQSVDPLRVVESIDVARPSGTHALAVVDRSGTLLLARQRERGLFAGGATVAASAEDKRARENGTETFWKPTADVADIADAVAGGLLAV